MNYCNSDYEFQNAKTYFLSLPFIEFAKKNQWNALLLNINGIDYMCPRYRTAVLTFHKGNMVDADGKAYPVDDVCYGKGLYMIGSVFHLQEEVFSSPSSSSYINKMRKNVITIDELPFFFKIPKIRVMYRPLPFPVQFVTDRVQMMQVDLQGNTPFFLKRHNALSYEGIISSRTHDKKIVEVDQIRAIGEYKIGFFLCRQALFV